MSSSTPDLRVGVDFGTTYTGISWTTPKEKKNEINIINQWPGESGSESKVPTVLAKRKTGRETGWGFYCNDLAEDKKWRLFKLLLDPVVYEKRSKSNGHEIWTPRTMNEVYQLVVEYLSQIYIHIRNKIPEIIETDSSFSEGLRHKAWAEMKIDFIFSTPTTWEAPVSQRFRGLVSEAGFDDRERHSVMLGLTEAEAAAVFTCQPTAECRIHRNNVVLSIDAGGGTTDLAFVKATDRSLTLEEIRPVTGIGVGSTKIDSEFAKLIEARINQDPTARSHLPTDFPLKASQSDDFQTFKHKFGSPDWDQRAGTYSIEVTGANDYTNNDLRIKRGKLSFTREELKLCFKKTLDEIKDLIKGALANFEERNHRRRRSTHVDYIVISGGLGSSKYVLKELKKYFDNLAGQKDHCVAGSSILVAKGDLRMVVVHGLLYDWENDAHTLGEHVARANYGIIVNGPLPRSANSRIRQQSAKSSTSKKERIHWLLKYEDTIKVGKPITIKVSRHLESKDQRRWTEEIVWRSGNRPLPLPEQRNEGEKRGMEVLHKVDLEVGPNTKLKTVRRWWGPTYHKCKFKLTLVVGPSGDCVVEVSGNNITPGQRDR